MISYLVSCFNKLMKRHKKIGIEWSPNTVQAPPLIYNRTVECPPYLKQREEEEKNLISPAGSPSPSAQPQHFLPPPARRRNLETLLLPSPGSIRRWWRWAVPALDRASSVSNLLPFSYSASSPVVPEEFQPSRISRSRSNRLCSVMRCVPPPDLSAHGPIRVGPSRNGYGMTFTGVWYWIECSIRLRDAGGRGLGMGWFGSVGRLGSKLFYGSVLLLTRNRPCLYLKYQIDSSLKSVLPNETLKWSKMFWHLWGHLDALVCWLFCN
jgi:hypothetical protein